MSAPASCTAGPWPPVQSSEGWTRSPACCARWQATEVQKLILIPIPPTTEQLDSRSSPGSWRERITGLIGRVHLRTCGRQEDAASCSGIPLPAVGPGR